MSRLGNLFVVCWKFVFETALCIFALMEYNRDFAILFRLLGRTSYDLNFLDVSNYF